VPVKSMLSSVNDWKLPAMVISGRMAYACSLIRLQFSVRHWGQCRQPNERHQWSKHA